MKYLFCVLCCLLNYIVTGQNLSTQVSLSPTEPKAGQKVLITYHPEKQISSSAIFCYLYQNRDETRVTVLPMQNTNNQFTAEFVIATDTKSFLMVFHDSTGVIDSNKDQGYMSAVYENGKPVAGAFASMADMHVGWRNFVFSITKNFDVALNLYQKEFAQNPYLKRKHYLFYLFALQGSKNLNKNQYKKELLGLTLYDDLTEVELRFLGKLFAEINENSTYRELKRLRFEKYPENQAVIEEDNRYFNIEFGTEKSFSKKKEMYDAFCSRYADLKDTISIKTTQFKRGSMLAKLAVYFLKENRVDEWETEVAKLNERARLSAFHLASCDLLNKEAYLDKAETFARIASNLQLKLLKTYKHWIEVFDLTEEQLRYYRYKDASWIFQNYGLVLMKNNKQVMADSVLREAAITYGQRENSEINNAYIDCLVKSGKTNLAQKEAISFVKAQKSSPHIDAFLNQINKSSGSDSLTEINVAINRIPVNLISEPLPFFNFVDSSGIAVTAESLKGKIVVVDCWATWCGSCIEGFAGMYNLQKKYKNSPDVLFLFLNTSEFGGNAEEKTRKLMESRNYNFRVIFDHENLAGEKLGINALPTKFVVDKEGKIRFRQVGEASGFVEKLDSVIEQLMN
jgi:thiol-disulfide isomerase/thioredoxin